ncbi:MAG: SGNH/GDSL hydrolase family protein [Gemmatimonadaceae bacterium]
MSRFLSFAGGARILMLTATLTACSESKDLVNPPPPVSPLFASYVSLGNSLTAGYQSGGISDSTQQQAFPVLVAQQMGTPFTIPALRDPGCPPPIANFLTGERVNAPQGLTDQCSFRSDVTGKVVINNVAVPGANSVDPTSFNGSGANALTTLILGGETQVQRALDANPTFVSAWIGNNDVLAAALSGILVPAAGISPGVTPVATFAQNYAALIRGLQAGTSLKGGVLFSVIQVAGTPALFPAALLVNDPRYKAMFDAAVGATVTIHPSCTATTKSLVSFDIVARMRAWLADPNPDPTLRAGVPPVLLCEKNQAGFPAPLGDIFVLDADEQASLSTTIDSYNAIIDSTANALGWAYADFNPTLAQLRSDTAVVPAFPHLDQPTKPYGDYFSLDGIHPAAAGQRLIADSVISVINAKFGTTIPKIGSVIN